MHYNVHTLFIVPALNTKTLCHYNVFKKNHFHAAVDVSMYVISKYINILLN